MKINLPVMKYIRISALLAFYFVSNTSCKAVELKQVKVGDEHEPVSNDKINYEKKTSVKFLSEENGYDNVQNFTPASDMQPVKRNVSYGGDLPRNEYTNATEKTIKYPRNVSTLPTERNKTPENFSFTTYNYPDDLQSYNYTFDAPVYQYYVTDYPEHFTGNDTEIFTDSFLKNVTSKFNDIQSEPSIRGNGLVTTASLIGKFAKIKRDHLSNSNFHQLQFRPSNPTHITHQTDASNTTIPVVNRNVESGNGEASLSSLFNEDVRQNAVRELVDNPNGMKNSTRSPIKGTTEREKLPIYIYSSLEQTTVTSTKTTQLSGVNELTPTIKWRASRNETGGLFAEVPSLAEPEVIRDRSSGSTSERSILLSHNGKVKVKSEKAFPIKPTNNNENIHLEGDKRVDLVNKYNELSTNCKNCLTSTKTSTSGGHETTDYIFKETSPAMDVISNKQIENKSENPVYDESLYIKTAEITPPTISDIYTTDFDSSQFETENYNLTSNNYYYELDYYNNIDFTETMTDSPEILTNITIEFVNETSLNGSASQFKISVQEFPWPVKREAVVEGDIILGGLMMVHEREDTITCGPVMPQGGIQALEAMLYTLDKLNESQLLPNISIGAHILDDCDKDTYGLEMAVDFIKGKKRLNI